jgi:hypothetical protein|tara:strand:+ start:424 stop:1158 length:735 start_codon:yes stop_codon:yes gene_type:complete
MALPIVETPRYELTLPSQETKVQYRPFLVKEEKILYVALESGDEKEMQQATKQILKSVTFDKLDVDLLPTFDVEYIFLQVRAKSVGEVVKFKIICPDDKTTYGDVEVDISKVEVQVDDAHTNNIVLDEKRKLGVMMNYPNMKVLYNSNVQSLKYEDVIDLIIGCIDYIYEGEKNYPVKESTKEELKDFLESLPQEQFSKIRKFFESMPRLRHQTKVKNPKTGVESDITFSGLQDFFGLASPTIA